MSPRRERLLNGLLALQVVLSLLLTGLVVFSPEQAAVQAEQPTVQPGPPTKAEAPDLLLPRLIWARTAAGEYAGVGPVDQVYHETWNEMRGVLSRTLGQPHNYFAPSEKELKEAALQPLLGLDLQFALPPGQWARLLGYPKEADLLQPAVDRLVFVLGSPGTVYLLGPRTPMRVAPLPESDRRMLLRLAQRIDPDAYARYRPLADIEEAALVINPFGLAYGPIVGEMPGPSSNRVRQQGPLVDPWVMVPAGPVKVHSPPVTAHVPPVRELVDRFFPDVTVVREVQEQDGATSFTDGQRLLRLYPYGAIQFWSFGSVVPAAEGTTDLEMALSVTTEFLTRADLWPDGVALAGYTPTADGAWLSFRLRGPALPWESRNPLLEVRLTGAEIRYLYRAPNYRLDGVVAPERLASPDEVREFVEQTEHSPQMRIRGVWLAHRLRRGQSHIMVPVWVVLLSEGEPMMVDARTGRFMW